ncbi:MAG: HEPN domain-containing protein [bacterium]|nr:HEPN domain-containing protein [bacterium]
MRSREHVIWDFVQQWLKKAEQDIKAARILLKAKVGDYYTCAFHCQQSAEKYLKAYLVRYQIEFRKAHNLDKLLNLAAEADTSLLEELSSCKWLTPYGTEFRYLGEYPEVNLKTAERAFNDATLVKNVVLKRLKEYF